MLNKRNKWSLSIGCIGRDMCYTLVALFLLTYLQFTGLFNTQQFIVLTVIIVICRVWDAINDPMMGTIITNTKSKFGKYRPWVLIGAISNSVVLVLMFTIRFKSGWVNVGFIGLMYLLWGMTYTMNDIAYWDLLPALTNEKKQRDQLTTLVAVFASVGAFAIGGLVPVLTPGNMVVMYRWISIVCAVIFLGCQLLVFFGVHDNKEDKFIDVSEQDMSFAKDDKVTLKGMVKILFSNKQLLVMAVVIFLYSLGSAILNAFGQNYFYFKFGYVESADGSMSGGTMMFIFTVIYAVGTLLSQAIYPVLANKWKRRTLITFSTILLVLGYVSFFLFGNLLKGTICFILICITGVLIFAGQGVFYLTMLVMLTNTIEYGEWETGKNNAAITFTVRPFMVKLSGAVQYGLVALTLIACGLYTITTGVGNLEVAIGMLQENTSIAEVNTYLHDVGSSVVIADGLTIEEAIKTIKVAAGELFKEASNASIWWLSTVMCVVPILLFVISFIVIKKKYVIDEETYDKIVKEIEERKNTQEVLRDNP